MISSFIAENQKLMLQTLQELCLIPAPSHQEQKRADYCKCWLERHGAKGVYIDEALNVIFPYQAEGSDQLTVFAAHTDTVFPDTAPMPYYDDGERIHCPGICDDTASVVTLLLMAKYYIDHQIQTKSGILFVCNSCEEGLGNLKGTRQLFADYQGRIKQFISFDSCLNTINDRCVGSHRYLVTATTQGGHSYFDFGNANAIAILSKMVSEIYCIQPPKGTTYNVGTIQGGTGVNTIAPSASMLCEYRSESNAALQEMKNQFSAIFDSAKTDGVSIEIELVGERPGANIDDAKIDALKTQLAPIIEKIIGEPLRYKSSSTDCNVPLSLGIPALCIGTNNFDGIHTREEWLEKATLPIGLEIAIRIGNEIA